MLELPKFYQSHLWDETYHIQYDEIIDYASKTKVKKRIKDSIYDKEKVALVLSDYQSYHLDICSCHIPNVCEFIYKNADVITDIYFFHKSQHMLNISSPMFWINSNYEHPKEGQKITAKDYKDEKWKVTNGVKANYSSININYVSDYLDEYFKIHKELEILYVDHVATDAGSATMTAVMEALYYFSFLRKSQVHFIPYANNALSLPISSFHHNMSKDNAFNDNSWVVDELKKYSNLIFSGLDSNVLIENIKYCYKDINKIKSFYLLKDCSIVDHNGFDYKSLKSKGLNILYRSDSFR